MSQVVSLVGRFDYNPHCPGYFAWHLNRAAKQLGISFTEDVFTIDGVQIGSQGEQFTLVETTDVSRLKLVTPLHKLIAFKHVKSPEIIWDDLQQVLDSDDLLNSLNEHQPLPGLVEPFISQLAKYPELLKALSVMAVASAELYERSLYCVWFTVVIANEMRCSKAGCLDLFLASLAHDVGMLHLNPEVLDKQPPLSQSEWVHIQKHVSIAQRWMLEVAELPTAVIEAVYEHHERCDGTGYPLGIVESEISYAGKVLGLADTLIGIYHNRFKPKGRGWRNVIPLMQMNAQEFFHRHGEVLATIWRRSEMPKKNLVDGDNLVEFFETIQQKHNELHEWFDLLRTSLTDLGFTHGDRQLHTIQTIMIHIATSARGSGIFNPEVAQWFKTVDLKNDEGAYLQLDRASVLQQEIRFHLQKLSHMTQAYVDSGNCSNPDMLKVLEDMLRQSKQYF